MGMYDTIRCEYPLPDPDVQNEMFQTKDLRSSLETYTITHDGKLRYQPTFRGGEVPEMELMFTGTIVFYTMKMQSAGWYMTYEYTADFESGRLVKLSESKEPDPWKAED